MSELIDYQQSSFNAGELSPLVKGREGLEKFRSGLKQCENALVLAHGPVTARGGLRYIGEVKDSSKEVRLVPFEFNEDQAYILEMGNGYMRVWMDGGQVVTPDAETVFLCHFNGDDGDIDFLDKSANAHTVTPIGNAQVDTVDPVYTSGDEAGNLLLDGTGDCVSITDHADFAYGTDPLTIDLWFYLDTVIGGKCLYYQEDTAGDENWIALWVDPDTGIVYFAYSNGGTAGQVAFTYSPGFAIDTWYHLALIRGWGDNVNDWMVTINGATCGSAQTHNMILPDYGEDPLIGAANSDAFIPDNSASNHKMTTIGNAKVSITHKKWGSGSLYFDGAGDSLTGTDHDDYDVQTDFTIDLWVKHSDHVGDEGYICQAEGGNNLWRFLHRDGAGLCYHMRTGGVTVVGLSGGEITDTDWHHVAMCKSGNLYGLYLDGTQVAYTSDSDIDTYAAIIRVGTAVDNAGGAMDFKGYMDDLRLDHSNHFSATPTVGLTDTITVPTAKHVATSDTGLLLRGDFMDMDGGIDELRISTATRWTEAFTVNTQEYPGAGGSTPYELASTPWTEEQVSALKWAGVGDILYVVHPEVAIYKISRTGHDVWTCDIVDWDSPPWKEMNDSAITLDPAAVTGSDIAIVASAAFFTSSHVGAYFKQANGFYLITAVTDSTNAVADIKSNLDDHVATADWYMSAWSSADGYPSCITFFEDRLCLSGAAGEPTKVRFSETSDYENMTVGVADSDPMAYQLLSQKYNKVLWLVGGKKLFIGTAGAEFWMSGAGVNTPITPTSVLARRESTIGSADIQPTTIGSSLMFIQRAGRTVNLWKYEYVNDSFEATDLGILAEHLMKDHAIADIQYAQDPDHIAWILRTDGKLLGLTHMADHDVTGWHKHYTSDKTAVGDIETFAVIPGTSQGVAMDEVWMVTKRTINGAVARYIEMLTPRFGNFDLKYAMQTDSCITYIGSPATVFTGADHLEGESVNILADGKVFNATISGGGFTLATAASVVTAGLPYTVTIEFLVALLTELVKGVTTAKRKRIVELLVMMHETCQLKYGVDTTHMFDLWNAAGLTDNALNDKYAKVEVDGNPEYEPTLMLKQIHPYPFTLLGIVETIEVED